MKIRIFNLSTQDVLDRESCCLPSVGDSLYFNDLPTTVRKILWYPPADTLALFFKDHESIPEVIIYVGSHYL